MQQWWRDSLLACLFLVLIAFLATKGAVSTGYNWQWERALPYFVRFLPNGVPVPGPLLASGLVMTLRLSLYSLVLALAVGALTAVLRLAGGPIARMLSLLYIQTVRNTPLMVQLLVLYFLVPVQWNLSSFAIAVLALGFFEGAYMAEIFRAGIGAVGQGQWEGAASLGLSAQSTWVHVIAPQALRHSLPPIVSQCVSLVKDSSLASIIAVSELAQQSGLAVSDTFLSFEIWLPVAGIYVCLALCLAGLAQVLAARLSRGVAPLHP